MRPALRALLFSGAAFNPLDLFAGGVRGITMLPGTPYGTAYQERTGASATTVCGHGDPVGTFHCKITGKYLTTDDDTKRPLYQIDGARHFLLGDGSNDWLRATFTITQPWDRVSAIRPVAAATSSHRIFGGGSVQAGEVFQTSGSANISMFSGSVLLIGAGPAVGADTLITERHNGASSRGGFNNNTYATGDAGITAPGGITVFAQHSGSAPSNVRAYGIIMREGSMPDAQISQIRTYLASRAGVTL